MSCVAHPEREGTAPCDTCGALMCDRCIDHAPNKWPGRCAACKAKDPKPLRPVVPVEPKPPPLPKSWSFRLMMLLIIFEPILPLLALVEFMKPEPAYHGPESPARIGIGSAMAMTLLFEMGLFVWKLLGVATLLARWRLARPLMMLQFAAELAIAAWVLTRGAHSPSLWVVVFWSVCRLAWFWRSADLKAALVR